MIHRLSGEAAVVPSRVLRQIVWVRGGAEQPKEGGGGVQGPGDVDGISAASDDLAAQRHPASTAPSVPNARLTGGRGGGADQLGGGGDGGGRRRSGRPDSPPQIRGLPLPRRTRCFP